MNGRWAMAAVTGILFTDAVGLPKFWNAGAEVRERRAAAAGGMPFVIWGGAANGTVSAGCQIQPVQAREC